MIAGCKVNNAQLVSGTCYLAKFTSTGTTLKFHHDLYMSRPSAGSEHGSEYVDNFGPSAMPKATSSRQGFFIVPPTLPPSQKEQYKPVTETSLKTEFYPKVDEVIGEYREGNNLYYFARYDGGIAHKVSRSHAEIYTGFDACFAL